MTGLGPRSRAEDLGGSRKTRAVALDRLRIFFDRVSVTGAIGVTGIDIRRQRASPTGD